MSVRRGVDGVLLETSYCGLIGIAKELLWSHWYSQGVVVVSLV